MPGESIKSIEIFIQQVIKIQKTWATTGQPWFRGQRVDEPLIPKLFRRHYDENEIVQTFRTKSPMLYETPNENEWDKWLCLMQHAGTPTRLLDWTEGALSALYFAIHKFDKDGSKPVVWMMNPFILNQISIKLAGIPLSFSKIGRPKFKYAFTKSAETSEKPIAFYPVNTHPRMSAQKSCFTLHGIDQRSIEDIFSDTILIQDKFLIKLKIDIKCCKEMLAILKILGITYSTLFPDLDGLGFELSQ